MELHSAAGLSAAPALPPACADYAGRLPLNPRQRRALLAQVAGNREMPPPRHAGANAVPGVVAAASARADAAAPAAPHPAGEAGEQRAMLALHRALAQLLAQAPDSPPNKLPDAMADAGDPAESSLAARLALACGGLATGAIGHDAGGGCRLHTAPPIRRTPMAPHPWPLRLLGWPSGRRVKPLGEQRPHVGTPRRLTLGGLTLAQTLFASAAMTTVLPYHGGQPLEVLILALFALLFAWVSAGFWMAAAGFVLLLTRRDRHAIAGSQGPPPAARTAVVMPVCNEEVGRVFAGLRATWESLAARGNAGFDFFVLSDSNDPDALVAELDAWRRLCRAVRGEGRIFYRRRRQRIKKKSGNIADFCRRWGRDYDYMVVLDADSVMSGDCLRALVGRMAANPRAGIIQTAPRAAGRDTLHARIQQFASRVYGPLFVAGMHFWQLGEAHYWGHNAIIRVAPFMRHCALGRLRRGNGHGDSIDIMSHDFVEAALMRRAGWGVWIAYDLPGSYEEMPPNLLDELQRDRRWCLGNLINARLLFAEGLHAAHRAVFVTGIMAYLSAPLWFAFLLLSTALLALHTLVPPQYFVRPYQLFPIWPEWHPGQATTLFAATALVLLLPKLLAVTLQGVRGAAAFGGPGRLALSVLLEAVYSMLLAPIRMLRHTRFVLSALSGRQAAWKSPARTDRETGWGEALRRHGLHTVLGIAWAAGVHALNPAFLWWLLPVVSALAFSIPLSVWSSRVRPGRRLRAAGLFVTPEESAPPAELRRLEALQQQPAGADFLAAVVDPLVNAVACASARERRGPGAVARRRELLATALADGPAGLSDARRRELLDDRRALSLLHFAVWASPAARAEWRPVPESPPCTAASS